MMFLAAVGFGLMVGVVWGVVVVCVSAFLRALARDDNE